MVLDDDDEEEDREEGVATTAAEGDSRETDMSHFFRLSPSVVVFKPSRVNRRRFACLIDTVLACILGYVPKLGNIDPVLFRLSALLCTIAARG